MAEEQNRQGQGGSGSAENMGRSREEQKHPNPDLTEQEKQDIANQIGVDKNQIADIEDTGALSGRDDAAGGSGDDIEDTSSNDGTERF